MQIRNIIRQLFELNEKFKNFKRKIFRLLSDFANYILETIIRIFEIWRLVKEGELSKEKVEEIKSKIGRLWPIYVVVAASFFFWNLGSTIYGSINDLLSPKPKAVEDARVPERSKQHQAQQQPLIAGAGGTTDQLRQEKPIASPSDIPLPPDREWRSTNEPLSVREFIRLDPKIRQVDNRRPFMIRDEMRLDYTTLDLLYARAAPHRLSDGLLMRMMLDRWFYEFGYGDLLGELPADRFYGPNQNFPSLPEVAALLPTYRAWIQEAIKVLPNRFRVFTSTVNGHNLGPLCGGFYGLVSHTQAKLPVILRGVVYEQEHDLRIGQIRSQISALTKGQTNFLGPVYFLFPSTNMLEENKSQRPDRCIVQADRDLQKYNSSLTLGAQNERLPVAVLNIPEVPTTANALSFSPLAILTGKIEKIDVRDENVLQPTLVIDFRVERAERIRIDNVDYRTVRISTVETLRP